MRRATARTAPALAATLAATFAVTLAAVTFTPRVTAAQDALDSTLVALTWHKLTQQPLDLTAVAAASDAVRRVSEFDRRDAAAAEVARLHAQLDAASPAREFTMRVSDEITQYDHDRGEFSIGLFRPGYYVPVQAFGQEYRLVFANADRLRAIAMAKESARTFDARLNALGRRVTNELQFRVTGAGDPLGGVTGPRVVRAELTAVRLLDASGNVVHTPTITASSVAANGVNGANGAPSGPSGAAAFDAARADVAGLRIGVKAKDAEATLTRLFGPVARGATGRGGYAGYAATLTVNDMGCMNIPGRRGRNGAPGSVCVTAFLDGDDVVRAIRIERVFPYVEAELFRRALVQKYGPVSAASQGVGFSLGWGPDVDRAVAYDVSGPHSALTAHYVVNDDFMSRGLNRAADVRVVLQLADAAWIAGRARR